MKARPGEHEDLRLAPKAADREKAAESQRREFEQRLTALGYPPQAIWHAYETLRGLGTVAMVSALGINVQLVFAGAFFVGALLAGLAGGLGGIQAARLGAITAMKCARFDPAPAAGSGLVKR